MDYKSVIEEQIRELQKLQDRNLIAPLHLEAPARCEIAKTITELCREVNQYLKMEGPN